MNHRTIPKIILDIVDITRYLAKFNRNVKTNISNGAGLKYVGSGKIFIDNMVSLGMLELLEGTETTRRTKRIGVNELVWEEEYRHTIESASIICDIVKGVNV